MGSHLLAIAKASFSANLLRPDPTSLPREEIEQFHTLLTAAILQCTAQNVQKCKRWIWEYVVVSTARFGAFGKYLTALTTSFTRESEGQPRETSTRRKKLHLLYLVNDLLYHAKYHVNDASIAGKIQPLLVGLIGSAASFKECPKQQGKILNLLNIWGEKGYYSLDYVDKLREAAKNAAEGGALNASVGEEKDQLSTKATKSAPFVMPATHGDASISWFDLPAGNLMPHIVPNSTRPMNPDMIKPLQFVAGPADESLASAVKELLDNVENILEGEADISEKGQWDIDELGQLIRSDEITGDVINGEGYYGWSRTFCEKMSSRKKGTDTLDRDRRGQSRSSSRSQRKRRHSQSDDGSSDDGYKSRRRRRSYSSSRSPSPGRRRTGRSRRNSKSDSYSRSPTPPNRPNPFARAPQALQNDLLHHPQPPPLPPYPQQGLNPIFPPPPLMQNMVQGQPFGAWPIPPIPPNMQFNPSQPWPPPPPPGPPPQQSGYQTGEAGPHPPGSWQQNQGNARGVWQQGDGYNASGGWNNRGRGGHRGRGRGW